MDHSTLGGARRLIPRSKLNPSSGSNGRPRFGWRWFLQLLLVLAGIFCCYRLAVSSVATGASRLFSMIAIFDGSVEPTDKAVHFAPNDPEAHYTRALSLVNAQRLDEALQELRVATQLRPHHYYEWLDLAVTLDRMGDQTGASDALKTSIQLAPSFAQPRWQLGNLLYRQGRIEEGFAELRLAAKSNPNLFRGMVDLASAVAPDDRTLEALVQPQTRRSRLELAKFLATRGDGVAAANAVQQAGEPTIDLEVALLREIISELLAAKQFSEARAVWMVTHPLAKGATDLILNGDFMDPIKQDDPGFGWQITSVPNVAVSIDPAGPASQTRSVRLEYGGDSVPQMQPIKQLILVKPKSRYTLTFMARTEGLVSGGPPIVLVSDSSSAVVRSLGQSSSLNSQQGSWNAFQVDFSTDDPASAVVIGLQRLPCSQSPCPIFGRLWLSRFLLVKS